MVFATSKQVLEYLENNQPASCTKIGKALDISRANVHYHISQFIEQGLVEQLPHTAVQQTRGRPTNLYRLSKQAHSDTLMHLTGCLLAEFVTHSKTQKEKTDALLNIAHRMFPQLNSEISSLPRHLNSILFRLNERGYKASWETHRFGPLITFRNCPYLSIIEKHPIICRIDTMILQEMLGATYVIAESSLMSETPHKSGDCKFFFHAL